MLRDLGNKLVDGSGQNCTVAVCSWQDALDGDLGCGQGKEGNSM